MLKNLESEHLKIFDKKIKNFKVQPLHKKWSFPLMVSSANVTKSVGCTFLNLCFEKFKNIFNFLAFPLCTLKKIKKLKNFRFWKNLENYHLKIFETKNFKTLTFSIMISKIKTKCYIFWKNNFSKKQTLTYNCPVN